MKEIKIWLQYHLVMKSQPAKIKINKSDITIYRILKFLSNNYNYLTSLFL